MIRGIPWWAKLSAKVALSRLPFGYRSWAALGLFRHGAMVDPSYALKVFCAHLDRAELLAKHSGFTCLELGPGDSLLSAPIACGYGAQRCYLVDSGDFASREMQPFNELLDLLESRGAHIENLRGAGDWNDVLSRCHASYCVDGLDSLRSIPDASVDFVWSQAVLEHVRKHEFRATIRELKRILRKGGSCSHTVDLRDHLNGHLNNLRFSERRWESALFVNSGFYTNRIRFAEMLRIFESEGFNAAIVSKSMWDKVPTPRTLLDCQFSALPDIDLLTCEFDVVLL